MSDTRSELQERRWGTDDLTAADRCQLFGAERRRVALDELAQLRAPVDLQELATAVADREFDSVDETAARRVAITLHHAHLPKMADLGVVEYDPGTNLVLSCPGLAD